MHQQIARGTITLFIHLATVFLILFNHEIYTQSSHIPVPSQPVTLHINLSSVNITWEYSESSTLSPSPSSSSTKFMVQILSPSYNDTDFHNLTELISTTHYVYSGLGYGIFYQFRVLAHQNDSFSDPSEASQIFDNGLTAPPGPPQNLHLMAPTANSVTLTWSEPRPSNELKYLYHLYNGADLNKLQLIDSIQESTLYTFTKLKPFTLYYFTVQADYGGERSILAPALNMTFHSSLLPSVSIVALTPNYTSIKVTWSDPVLSDYNILLQRFTIMYTPLPVSSSVDSKPPPDFKYSVNVTGSQFSTVVRGLEQNTTYAFKVRYTFTSVDSLTNYTGSKDGDNVKMATTCASLSCTSCHSVSSTELAISWKVLNEANQSHRYVVTAVHKTWSESFVSSESNGTFVASQLHPWTTYEFEIFLGGVYGNQSSLCSLLDCRTKEDKPTGAPTNVIATPLNTTAINVSWSVVPIPEQNGIVKTYVIGCVHCPIDQYVSEATQLFYVVMDLEAGKQYTFVVAAENDVGFGPDSQPVTARTKEKKLTEPPVNVSVQYISQSFVTVSWKPPSGHSADEILLYTVTITETTEDTDIEDKPVGHLLRRRNTLTAFNYSINTTSTSVNLTDLTYGATYTVWVSAWTGAGQGPLSLVTTFHINDIGNDSCLLCTLNMTVAIMNPSRKCFDMALNWQTRVLDNVKFHYYNLTLLTQSGDVAFNRRFDGSNMTSFKISSDQLHSDTLYSVLLEVRLSFYESQFSLLNSTSIKTPSCTGVTTVVAVVITSVCVVFILILVGAVLLIFQKWYSKKKTRDHNYSPTRMSRQFVINNDYISLMKQQRGDGHSTNTGSEISTDGVASDHAFPNLTGSVDEDDSSSENEHDPLLRSSPVFFAPFRQQQQPQLQHCPPLFTSSTSSHSSMSDRAESIHTSQTADGYIVSNSLPPILITSIDSKDVPDRPCPEGSSLSSISLESIKSN